METFTKEMYEMVEAHFGRFGARLIFRICVLAVICVALQAIYTSAIAPFSANITGLFTALRPTASQQELIQSVVQLFISLSGFGLGALLIIRQRQVEKKVAAVSRTAAELEENSGAIMNRIRYYLTKIEDEKSQKRKIVLLKELLEGEFSLDEWTDTQLHQGTEQKKQQ